MNTGETIIQAVIRAAAIESAIPNEENGMIFVWSANAPEQIEAAISELGVTLIQNDELENLRANYHQLILAVASKHEGEDRHATALRYIQERENHADSPSSLSTQNDQAQTPRERNANDQKPTVTDAH
jgi:hypothetical protein